MCWTVPPCSYLHGRPALGPSCTEISTLDTGTLIMVQQVRLIMFSLNMLDYSMSFLLLSTLITILSKFYSLGFVVTPPSCLKVTGGLGWGGVVAPKILV